MMDSTTAWLNGIGLERVHYFPRQLITAEDMIVEQEYFRQKLRRHNRFLHGWGVVYGLEVNAAATPEKPWQVSITCGYALSPQGDEIYVAQTICYDLVKCGPEPIPNPCEPGGPPLPAPNQSLRRYLAIRYNECPTRPVRVHPAGCGCDETLCETSRIRDDFAIGCLPEPPPSPPPIWLCEVRGRKEVPPCPPCPEEPWVVLAEILLPSSATAQITSNNIDNFARRQLYSTTLLQEQLIACCCDERRPAPATLLKVGNVRIIGMSPSGMSGIEVFNWSTTPPDPDQPISVPFGADSIEITFTGAAVDFASITATTFKVEHNDSNVPGQIMQLPPNTVRWTHDAGPLPRGEGYQVTLVGDGSPAIRSADNHRLDGEVQQTLPSGNGEEGGNFVFTFQVLQH